MFFEVNITPKEKTPPVNDVPETKFSLLLAPFQPQTRIKIETAINTTAACCLSLKNPSNRSLNVQVTKEPPSERSVCLNLTKLKIEPEENAELIITWVAREHGTFRNIIQLTDSRRIKYDIALTTSTIIPKKNGGNCKSLHGDVQKKVSAQNVSPKKQPEYKRALNLADNVNSPSKKQKPSFTSKYQGKENIATYQTSSWQTPKRNSSSILGHREEKSSDISAGKLRDFSMLIESDTFALTPLPWLKNNDKLKPANNSTENSQFTSQSYTALFSPPKLGTHELRRETYTTDPVLKNTTFTNEDVHAELEDSLSPRETVPVRNSDFSMLINDLNFTCANATNVQVENVIPNAQFSRLQFNSPCSEIKNDTFEVVKSSEIKDLSKLSLDSTSRHRLAPTRLSTNFARLSPVMPIEHRATKYAMASSPICETRLEEEFDRSFSSMSRLEVPRHSLNNTVQDVLEADLWAKPANQYFCTTSKTESSSLHAIQEETVNSTPITNKTYVTSFKKTSNVFTSPSNSSQRSENSSIKTNNGKKTSPMRKISPKKFAKVSKDKSVQELQGLKKKATLNTSLKNRGKVSISGVRITKLSLSGVARPKKSNRNVETEVSIKLHDPDDFFARLCNPDPFAATTTEDPFLASTLYYDDEWVANQEGEFKKWLNALLTPPEHLTSNVDTPFVDVAKIWQSCRLKEDVSLAETKEAVSARYHTNERLSTLRRAACTMLRSEEVVAVLSRVTVCVEKGNLVIRQDRDLHKDIGLQKLVLELFLSYNPLWLRIGLEAIYGETIPLNSNSDILRLSKFLLTRFFSDPYIVKTHSHHTVSNLRLPTFLAVMNKFMLKKFLFLVYFLDYAKTRKLIGHDPCLFHKQAAYKESKRILLKFSQELLGGVGDVTRVLKPYGYILFHKQTELDEYCYAVNNLSLDLRDGVRLCRVMEMITGKRNLTAICRVPAISRLQKVYNVDVALKALTTSGYTVCGNITAKCIADGHREKTLSLLWQIIYKFQAPHFNKAAKTVQKWWRAKLWWVRVKNFLWKRKNNAAYVIQRSWKSYWAKKQLEVLKKKQQQILVVKNQAAKLIQRKWRAAVQKQREKRKLQLLVSSTLIIQRSWKNHKATKPFEEEFKRKRNACRIIQQRWRDTKMTRLQMSVYLIMKDSAIKIQSWWRLKLAQKTDRVHFLELKKATVLVQRKWRGNKLMKIEQKKYLAKINAAKIIQEWWRHQLIYRKDRNNFLLKKDAVRSIGSWWLRYSVRKKLINKERNAAIFLQRKWRAVQVGRQQREEFITLKNSVINIQRKWRANRDAKLVQRSYVLKKTSAIVLQQRFRAVKDGREQRKSFMTLKKSVIFVQRKWRANKLATSTRKMYVTKRNAAIIIQSYWRNWEIGFEQRSSFLSLKAAAICIQDRFRANKACREACKDFNKIKQSVIILQRRWRARKMAMQTKQAFLNKKKSAIVIQRKYKTIIAARKYKEKKQAVVKIQLWWKACLIAKETKSYYDLLKCTTIFVQQKYRARKLGASVKQDFETLRKTTIFVQRNWRAKKLAQPHRENFLAKLRAVNKIQVWWKACSSAKETKSYYNQLKSTTIFVQRRYRAVKLGSHVREEFNTLKTTVIYIQQKWRATKLMQQYRKDFVSKKNAANKIQSWWKACLIAKETKSYYDMLKCTTIFVQQKYRARKLGASIKRDFETLRKTIIFVQRKWRAEKLAQPHRESFLAKLQAVKKIQVWWKACLLANETKSYYDLLRSTTIFVQQKYRARKLGASVKQDFETLKTAIIFVQRKWRAKQLRENYLAKQRAVIKIQIWWKSIIEKKICQDNFMTKKIAAIYIQRWYRSTIEERIMRKQYNEYKNSIDIIQSWWKEILLMRQKKMKRKISAATIIQTIWRGHKIRRSQSKEMTKLRERSEKAMLEAQPTETMAHRLKVAIVIVQEYDNLGKLTQGVTALDTITHLLPQGCIALCEANLIGKLYDLLHRSNRSRPWMDICLRASSILVSISKYSPTKSYAWREEYIETMIRLLSATMERDTSIFLNLATLLWLLADSPARIKAIAESPATVRSLSTMYNTVSRKRSRLSSGPKLPPQTCVLPNPKPDWGLRHSRPRLFTSVHHAVSSLCKRLKIKPMQ